LDDLADVGAQSFHVVRDLRGLLEEARHGIPVVKGATRAGSSATTGDSSYRRALLGKDKRACKATMAVPKGTR
jgi:hypothetical protein